MYSRVLCMALASALASCNTNLPAAPGISPAEMHVLQTAYYWQYVQKPLTYTSQHLDALLRRSIDPTLDGEAAELQMSSVVYALATVGDETFAEAIARQPDAVKRAVARDVADLWRRYDLHYPKTQSVLQPYI